MDDIEDTTKVPISSSESEEEENVTQTTGVTANGKEPEASPEKTIPGNQPTTLGPKSSAKAKMPPPKRIPRVIRAPKKRKEEESKPVTKDGNSGHRKQSSAPRGSERRSRDRRRSHSSRRNHRSRSRRTRHSRAPSPPPGPKTTSHNAPPRVPGHTTFPDSPATPSNATLLSGDQRAVVETFMKEIEFGISMRPEFSAQNTIYFYAWNVLFPTFLPTTPFTFSFHPQRNVHINN